MSTTSPGSTSPSDPTTTSPPVPERQAWLALTALCAGLFITLMDQALVAVALTVRFRIAYDDSLPTAAWHGVFHAVSAFNNAGFALWSTNLVPVVTDPWLVLPITVCLSLGIGALFPLTLIVTLDHARSATHAGALLGFVQGGGYMLSSLMPLVAGALRSQGHSLALAWAIMLACCVVLAAMAWRFAPLPATHQA